MNHIWIEIKIFFALKNSIIFTKKYSYRKGYVLVVYYCVVRVSVEVWNYCQLLLELMNKAQKYENLRVTKNFHVFYGLFDRCFPAWQMDAL